MKTTEPSYIDTWKSGILAKKIQLARTLPENCGLCPRMCGVNRVKGELGFCRAPGQAMVSSFTPHFGEEPPISGTNGSGTVFFAHCNLRCRFCQNYVRRVMRKLKY